MISVIIPNKAGRPILTDLRHQTFGGDMEVIIIRDKELKGQSWAINKGLNIAKGRFAMFLDDDLTLDPNLLRRLHAALAKSSADIAYCNFNRTGAVTGVFFSRPWNVQALRLGNYISNCSMVRRSTAVRFDEDIHRLKDWDYWLTMAGRGSTGVYVNDVLFSAHYQAGDISSSNKGYAEAVKKVRKKHNLMP